MNNNVDWNGLFILIAIHIFVRSTRFGMKRTTRSREQRASVCNAQNPTTRGNPDSHALCTCSGVRTISFGLRCGKALATLKYTGEHKRRS